MTGSLINHSPWVCHGCMINDRERPHWKVRPWPTLNLVTMKQVQGWIRPFSCSVWRAFIPLYYLGSVSGYPTLGSGADASTQREKENELQLPKCIRCQHSKPPRAREGLATNKGASPWREFKAQMHGPSLRLRRISIAVPALASSSFNSIPQVLFTFQSPYLFTIGLVSIFRLARDSPRLFKQHAQVVLLLEQHRSLRSTLSMEYVSTRLSLAFGEPFQASLLYS